MKHAITALFMALTVPASTAAWADGALQVADGATDTAADWTLAGRLGLMQFIVVPESSARDRDYYNAVIERSCGKEETCFLRFFTNSTGATPAVPLPDAILAEPTAMFQRSIKQLREQFQWSCRLQLAEANCF